ncbi:MAG: hypothetical protein WCN88_05575 [Candidatus Falkowbacteria bacterium]
MLKKAKTIQSKYFADLAAKKASVQSDYDSTNVNILHDTRKVNTDIAYYEGILKTQKGFTREYVALERASLDGWNSIFDKTKEGDSAVFFLLWLIRFVFIVLEVLPTWYKLKTPVGDYDWALYSKEKVFAQKQKDQFKDIDADNEKLKDEENKKRDKIRENELLDLDLEYQKRAKIRVDELLDLDAKIQKRVKIRAEELLDLDAENDKRKNRRGNEPTDLDQEIDAIKVWNDSKVDFTKEIIGMVGEYTDKKKEYLKKNVAEKEDTNR